jgi:hypothetical protein
MYLKIFKYFKSESSLENHNISVHGEGRIVYPLNNCQFDTKTLHYVQGVIASGKVLLSACNGRFEKKVAMAMPACSTQIGPSTGKFARRTCSGHSGGGEGKSHPKSEK